MYKSLCVIACLVTIISVRAQIIDPKAAARRAAENRANNKIDQGVNKGLDKMEEGIGGIFKKKKKNGSSDSGNASGNKNSNNSADNGDEAGDGGSFNVTRKYDFVPGEKIIAFEDFSQDALGDFPAKWNTNGSGELVKINDNKSKSLKLEKETVFYPEFINGLPDNFTLEYDLSSTKEYSFYSTYFITGFTSTADVGKQWNTFKRFGNRAVETKSTVEFGLHPTSAGGSQGMTYLATFSGGAEVIKNENEQAAFRTNGSKTSVHVAVWRQRGRLRVYVNDTKVWDVPKAFADGIKINSLYFRFDEGNGKDAYFVSNVRVAVGAPDTRNKLITEGKFVTTGILFDVNSDRIRPESYGVLKDIAGVLQENSDVKVKIVGHTDSDGDDAGNMALSKKRAESVKKSLSGEFGIDAGRMTTDGKGESQPADTNSTPAGKANNRRVEFIKQ